MTNLSKTVVDKLENVYIDCSYTNRGSTVVVNIEIPDKEGNEVRIPFTIRAKDGYALKYDDKTGSIIFRFTKPTFKEDKTEEELIKNYSNYFIDYTFNLSNISSYKNEDPVIEYNPPTYLQEGEVHGRRLALFEYSDIEPQKENIYIFKTGIEIKGKQIYIVSYYGNDPKRCKLDIVTEVSKNLYRSSVFEIKTKSGKMFIKYPLNGLRYEGGYNPDTGISKQGKKLSPVASISVLAEKVGETVKEDATRGLFTTYILSEGDLKLISDESKISTEIIINTYSYPIKFDETNLLETDIVLGNTPTKYKAKRFKIAEPRVKLFTFNVPFLKDVESCKLLLPFTSTITLDYDIIRGKVISGYIQYEVSTNSSTLYIDNGDVEFYKDTIDIETSVPFKPTGEYSDFKEPQKRLGKQTPTLLIKCLQEEKQHHFIQGQIEYAISGILKDELSLLNQELNKGVFINE